MPNSVNARRPSRDPLASALLIAGGLAGIAGGAYALSTGSGTVAGALFFAGVSTLTLAAFEPRLRGPVSVSGLKFSLEEYPTADRINAGEAGQLMTAEAGRFQVSNRLSSRC